MAAGGTVAAGEPVAPVPWPTSGRVPALDVGAVAGLLTEMTAGGPAVGTAEASVVLVTTASEVDAVAPGETAVLVPGFVRGFVTVAGVLIDDEPDDEADGEPDDEQPPIASVHVATTPSHLRRAASRASIFSTLGG